MAEVERRLAEQRDAHEQDEKERRSKLRFVPGVGLCEDGAPVPTPRFSKKQCDVEHRQGLRGLVHGTSASPMKLVIIGDSCVGKTCMISTLTEGRFPDEMVCPYAPQIALAVDGGRRTVSLTLWDTKCGEDYAPLRPRIFPGTCCFLVCYSCVSRSSFESVERQWLAEMQFYLPHVPWILVGLQSDLRNQAQAPLSTQQQQQKQQKQQKQKQQAPVTADEGKELACRLGAASYLECSALEDGSAVSRGEVREDTSVFKAAHAAARAGMTYLAERASAASARTKCVVQ